MVLFHCASPEDDDAEFAILSVGRQWKGQTYDQLPHTGGGADLRGATDTATPISAWLILGIGSPNVTQISSHSRRNLPLTRSSPDAVGAARDGEDHGK